MTIWHHVGRDCPVPGAAGRAFRQAATRFGSRADSPHVRKYGVLDPGRRRRGHFDHLVKGGPYHDEHSIHAHRIAGRWRAHRSAAVLLMALTGRIAGVSGIVARLLPHTATVSLPAVLIVAGLVLAPVIVMSRPGIADADNTGGRGAAGRRRFAWSALVRSGAMDARPATGCVGFPGCLSARWSRPRPYDDRNPHRRRRASPAVRSIMSAVLRVRDRSDFRFWAVVSGMSDPAKVLNFLDLAAIPAGTWDPSLLFVMAGAIAVTFTGFRFVLRRRAAAIRRQVSSSGSDRSRCPRRRWARDLRCRLGPFRLLPRSGLDVPRRRIVRRDHLRPRNADRNDCRALARQFPFAAGLVGPHVMPDSNHRDTRVRSSSRGRSYQSSRRHRLLRRADQHGELRGQGSEFARLRHRRLRHGHRLRGGPHRLQVRRRNHRLHPQERARARMADRDPCPCRSPVRRALYPGKLGGKIGIGEQITIVQETFGKVFNEGTEFQRDGSQFDRLFKDGDSYTIGTMTASPCTRPGHTPGLHDPCDRRCGLCRRHAVHAGRRHGARRLSRRRRAHALPLDQARACAAPARRGCSCATTTGRTAARSVGDHGRASERAHNIHVQDGITEDEFVAMREARDRLLRCRS